MARNKVPLECCERQGGLTRFCRVCGRMLTGGEVLENPETGNRYERVDTLAQGGMSTTYLVFNHQTDRLAVLKEIDADLSRKAKARELFLREAQVLAGLDHGGIPRFYDYFSTDERHYLVMEMIHGLTLEQVQPRSAAQAAGWMIETCQVLGYLHSLQPPVIHRDIKPANLILRYNPREVVLIDYGAVKLAGGRQGTRIATPGYSPPEQGRGRPCLQSDIYGVGMTLVFLLTRQFPGRFYHPRERRLVGLEEAGIEAPLAAVIAKATAYHPQERHRDSQELAHALSPFALG
ncbi:MAG: serine/threonine protein kinase [Aphanocapsa lilacina HA4352-LM1]|nr:serine/threonine protein kinase [Aphanocapsa lilacina HA4352-LM1]